MTAPDLPAEIFERGWFREVLAKEKDDLLNAFLSEALLACAEEFLLRRRLHQKRHR